jgi:hypothetical protein
VTWALVSGEGGGADGARLPAHVLYNGMERIGPEIQDRNDHKHVSVCPTVHITIWPDVLCSLFGRCLKVGSNMHWTRMPQPLVLYPNLKKTWSCTQSYNFCFS